MLNIQKSGGDEYLPRGIKFQEELEEIIKELQVGEGKAETLSPIHQTAIVIAESLLKQNIAMIKGKINGHYPKIEIFRRAGFVNAEPIQLWGRDYYIFTAKAEEFCKSFYDKVYGEGTYERLEMSKDPSPFELFMP